MGGLAMATVLDLGAAIFSAAASAFWFLAASGRGPRWLKQWGMPQAMDPIYYELNHQANMNKLAAALTGLSAVCMAIEHFVK
jgi:hypothetical protein